MIEKIVTLPSCVWTRKTPVNFESQDEFLFETNKEIILPEMNLYHVKGKNILLDEDGSISEGMTLVAQSLRLPQEMIGHYTFFKKIKRRLKYKKIKFQSDLPIVFLSDYWSGEYYHFLIETLSRLIFYKKHFKDFIVATTYRHKSNFHQRVFEIFNLNQIIYIPQKSFLSLDECFFCDFPGPPDIHRPDIIREIHLELTKDLPSITPFRNIYLSRQKANKRRILNNDDVETELVKLGFEVVCAEDLSFDEQRKLFFETKNLVTVHGAGLSNVLFMQPQTKVIEIKKDSWGKLSDGSIETTKFYNTYWHLCQILSLDYYYLKSPARDNDQSAHYADLEVNTVGLLQLIREII